VPDALQDTRPILKRQNDGILVLRTFLMAMEIDYLIHADCQRIVPVQASTKLHKVFLNYRRVQAELLRLSPFHSISENIPQLFRTKFVLLEFSFPRILHVSERVNE